MSNLLIEDLCRLARELQDANEQIAFRDEMIDEMRNRQQEFTAIIRGVRQTLGGPECPMSLASRAALVVRERDAAVSKLRKLKQDLTSLFR